MTATPHLLPGAPRIDLEQLIDERGINGFQSLVVVLGSLLVLFEGYDLQTMALAVPSVGAEWGVPASALAAALSAVFVGLAVGSLLIAPRGDHWGRKPMLVAAMLVMGGASLCTATASNVEQIFLWRFLTGVGLGIGAPTVYALVADYMPTRHQAFSLAILACSYSFGGFVAGFIVPLILPQHGWRGIFVVGGVVPLLFALALLVWLPESVKYLVLYRRAHRSTASVLRRLKIYVEPQLLVVNRGPVAQRSLLTLVRKPYLRRSILYWLLYTTVSFVFYGMANWLPTLLRSSGMSIADALRCSSMIWGGGVAGALLLSWLIDRLHRRALVIGSALLMAAAVLSTFPFFSVSTAVWGPMLLVVGLGIGGVIYAMPAVGASLYPTTILATGIGCASGIARLGGILSPVAGGWAIDRGGYAPSAILASMAVPAVLAAILAVILLRTPEGHTRSMAQASPATT